MTRGLLRRVNILETFSYNGDFSHERKRELKNKHGHTLTEKIVTQSTTED